MTEVIIDLHLHSTASDGTLSPAEVVAAARQAGVRAMALTDHDTLEGAAEAAPAAREAGIEFFPAVELNTDAAGMEIDILGYFAGQPRESFQRLLADRAEARIRRAREIVENLNRLGIDISYDRVREIAGGVVARPHIAQAMIEKGYATSQKDAYDRYIGFGAPAYAERDRLTPEQAIQAVLEGGGLPVVAHPGLVEDDAMVERLLQAGAAGLEAYYVFHTPEQVQTYREMAARYGAIVTCGTNSHGPGRSKAQPIGSMPCPAEVLDIFREKVEEASRR